MSDLTIERLKELLRYDAETGEFWWRVRRPGRAKLTEPAGCTREGGYRVICVDQHTYRAHRLAVLYVTGEWPKYEIDHQHGKTADNRFAELRDVPHALNAQNMKKPTGIEYRPANPHPYRVSITINGRKTNVGSYLTEAEAKAARLAAKLKHHPGYVPPDSPQHLP
jgi:hypothetical protein